MKERILAPLPRVSIQVFCESQQVASFIQELTKDRRMMRIQLKIHMGGIDAAVEAYRQAPTPNVIIIETASTREHLINQLDVLAEYCDSGTKVVVIGKSNDIVLYRELRARGVSEYLVQPLQPIDFISALSDLFGETGVRNIGRILSFFGAKGGVGASTIAHNVAWTMANQTNTQASVLDLDFGFGTAGLNFNQDPSVTLGDVLRNLDRVDSNTIDRLLVSCGDKLNLAVAPALLDRTYDFNEGDFDQLLDAVRSLVPLVVLDVPHVWSAWSRRTLVASDELIIVAAPDLANLRNARNIIDVMRNARPNDQAPKLILNMTNVQKRPEISVEDFSRALELTPLSVIPYDAKLFGTAANNGQMISEVDQSNKTFQQIAEALTGKAEAEKPKKSFLDPFFQKLSKSKAS